MARGAVFVADEIAAVYVMSRLVRPCFLMGNDSEAGKKRDHRKAWIEWQLERFAELFGIDLLAFPILLKRFHLVMRSRSDVVRLSTLLNQCFGRLT